jgi:hypothetical protein
MSREWFGRKKGVLEPEASSAGKETFAVMMMGRFSSRFQMGAPSSSEKAPAPAMAHGQFMPQDVNAMTGKLQPIP